MRRLSMSFTIRWPRVPIGITTLLVAGALLLPATPVAATASICNASTGNLMPNCGFESAGAYWVLGGNPADAGVTSQSAHTGLYGFEAGAPSSESYPDGTTETQTVSTTSGHAYALAFWLNAAAIGSPSESGFQIEISEGSTSVAGFGFSGTASGWQWHTLSWIAGSTSTTVEFSFWGGTGGRWYLDDVTLVEVPDMTGSTATKAKGKVTVDLASLVTWTDAQCKFAGRNPSWQDCTDGQLVKTSAKYLYVRGSNDGGTTWGPELYVQVTR